MRSLLLAILASFFGASFAEESVVFGLPLGGKLAKAPAQCPAGAVNTDVLCWVDKPFRDKSGGLNGLASLPDAQLPKWAAGHLPRVHVDKSRALQSIRFESNDRMWRDQDEIVQSISQRFGPPSRFADEGVSSSTWERSWVRIEFACVERNCSLSLISSAAMQSRDNTKPTQRPPTL